MPIKSGFAIGGYFHAGATSAVADSAGGGASGRPCLPAAYRIMADHGSSPDRARSG
ncbi:hypothetical protein M5362_02735 [Streptomyces sp. Je 1-79]|uniref:hypothetical protein n=1 Tax=Streptomyces sp. Je 1-79 TaxID=2943847 RepID=UPI0021A64919|nr:hypothetical protein [Streptomyces sp. Je 1-79]MCT4352051.1 hypothetical protein [Streptomyces sp. Je 1-79]